MGALTLIDKNGNILVDFAWKDKKGNFTNCEKPQNSIEVEYLCEEKYKVTTNNIEHFILKPIWNFETQQWQEAATAAELLAAYPTQPPVPPSLEERTAATESAIMALMGGV